MRALTGWPVHGIPEFPKAWLDRVAKNKAIVYLRKDRLHPSTEEELQPEDSVGLTEEEMDTNFLQWQVADSHLRMMFVCCHPGISVPSQIALALKTLCGFSVREIANAFMTKERTIETRLGRARKYFRTHGVELDPSAHAMMERRGAVLSTLYLLFREGYKQTDGEGLFDRERCLEAMRLAQIMAEHPELRSPESLALFAWMTLVAARFETRTNDCSDLVLRSEENPSLWNWECIERGFDFLARSERDRYTSTYHLEAAIEALRVTAPSAERTDWPAMLDLYQRLYDLDPSSVVAMHTSVPMCHVHGADAAIALLIHTPLHDHYLYHTLLGDAYLSGNRSEDASSSFRRATALAANAREQYLIERRLAGIGERSL